MVRSNQVNVLFVPYQPKRSTQLSRNNNDENGTVSWQKHASREYHRRNREKRTEYIVTDRKPGYHVKTSQVLRLQPRADSNGAEDLEESYQDLESISPVRDAAFSQLDPFGVIIRPDIPKYALKMFHHSTHAFPSQLPIRF